MSFVRTSLLIGEENLIKLKNSSVAVFGVGGVGGYAVEALARSGVGKITVFDNDTVCESNINRQIIATTKTIGQSKVKLIKDRVLEINPNAGVTVNDVFFLPSNAEMFDFSQYDYVIDAVDTVSAKIQIISSAKAKNVPVISCMGTGGKTDPTKLTVCDISKTSGCPLARVMRRELSARGLKDVKVVFTDEKTVTVASDEKKSDGRGAPPSMIFVPATAGLILAREVVFDLIK